MKEKESNLAKMRMSFADPFLAELKGQHARGGDNVNVLNGRMASRNVWYLCL